MVKQRKQYSVLIKCIFFVWVHISPNDPILVFSLFFLSPNSHQSPGGYCVDLHLSGFCARFTCVCMQLFSSPPCLLYLDFISSFSCYSDFFEQNKICFKKTYQESLSSKTKSILSFFLNLHIFPSNLWRSKWASVYILMRTSTFFVATVVSLPSFSW